MSRRFGIALALLTAAQWGSVPIAGKVALTGLPRLFLPFALLGFTALLFFLLTAALRPKELAPLRRPHRLIAPMGVTLGLNHVLYFVGLSYTRATSAELLIQLAPLFLVAFGVLWFHESLHATKIAGTAAAVVGVLVITWRGESLGLLFDSGELLGNAMIVGAALAWALYAAGQKVLNATIPPYTTLFAVYAVAAVMALPLALLGLPGSVPLGAWLGLIYLALVTVGSFSAFAVALNHAPASTLAIVTTVAPLFTILYVLATQAFAPAIAPDEAVTWLTWLGSALVVAGVALVSRGDQRSRRGEDG